MDYGEFLFANFLLGRTGRFHTKLFETIMSADPVNFMLLAEVFPNECRAVKRYKEEPGYPELLDKNYQLRR